ncbi:MAG: insulinase family protein, partial [Ramlibacter sp.]
MKHLLQSWGRAVAVSAALVTVQAGSAQTAPKTEQFVLPNGLTVIVKPDRRAPTAVHML